MIIRIVLTVFLHPAFQHVAKFLKSVEKNMMKNLVENSNSKAFIGQYII